VGEGGGNGFVILCMVCDNWALYQELFMYSCTLISSTSIAII
jgi:hypothetical protein